MLQEIENLRSERDKLIGFRNEAERYYKSEFRRIDAAIRSCKRAMNALERGSSAPYSVPPAESKQS